MTLLGIALDGPTLLLGLVVGMTYGLLAVGLVIVYRISGIINFAHGAIGALGAAVLGLLVVKYSVPYWLAFVFAVVAAAMAGALAEVAVVRRLRNAPRIMSLVATLGLAAFFGGVAPALYAGVNTTLTYPQPTGLPTFEVSTLVVTPAFTGMLVLSPLLVVGFAVFLRYTRYGMALRAVAANPATARIVGIRAARMSTLAWVIASGFAAFTAILVNPTRGFSGGEPFGPALLLRALGAAVVAQMTNLPVALAAGVGIGLAEQTIYRNSDDPGLPSVFIFALIFLALLVQRRGEARARLVDAWAVVAAAKPVDLPAPARARLRQGSYVFAGIAAVWLLALPQLVTNATSLSIASVLGLAVVALSVGVVTGLGGHLSLGQFAFAGVGAAASLAVSTRTGNFPLSFLAAGAAGAAVAVLVGLPALRIRGIMYAVATLGFGFMAEGWLLRQEWLFAANGQFPRPQLLGTSVETGRGYYYWTLAVTMLAVALVVQLRRGGLARTFLALRDNEDAARAFSIPAVIRSLQVFATGGFLAGIGGALYAHGNIYVSGTDFTGLGSINVVAAAVLGGLAYPLGPLLGALYIFAVPEFVPLDSAGLAGTALGWLLLVLYVPGGLGSLVIGARDRLVTRFLADPSTAEAPAARSAPRLAPLSSRATATGGVLLGIDGVTKSFGGVRALQGVTLQVRRGEILGLIGPNGAGKTTLFEVLSGFTRPDSGRVLLDSVDITGRPPEARAGLGIARSFQDARLFPTMTVLEALRLAQERNVPVAYTDALFNGARSERERDRLARELVELMGLQPYADKRINELSTGTRRFTELACMMALRPRVLLLDEPSSGIAQRESEALGGVLRAVRDHLDATLVVIDHDVPLVLGLADRVAAMEAGSLLLVAEPDVVVADPRVIESYLGGDPTAVQRSRSTAGSRPRPSKAAARNTRRTPTAVPVAASKD